MPVRNFRQNPQHLPPKAGEPPLHSAARLGDHDAIRQLIAKGAHVDAVFDLSLDPGGREMSATALMVAAGSGEGATVQTMRLLLDAGADAKARFSSGSIGRFAAGGLGWNYRPGGDAARLRLCLELGCDPNETDARGVTLLAEATGTGDVERVHVLLAAKARPDAAAAPRRRSQPSNAPFDENGLYPFQIPLHNAVGVDKLEMVEQLIGAGADPCILDNGRRTALFRSRSPEVARRLVAAGLDIEARDCLDWTPLVGAIHEGSLPGVKALIAAGADVNAVHDRGFTVFMSAVGSSERRLEIMRTLVEAGADPHAVSELGWNAFHAAIDVNGADANSEESIRSTFEFLVGLGVDINRRDGKGCTPLSMAEGFVRDGTEALVLRRLGART